MRVESHQLPQTRGGLFCRAMNRGKRSSHLLLLGDSIMESMGKSLLGLLGLWGGLPPKLRMDVNASADCPLCAHIKCDAALSGASLDFQVTIEVATKVDGLTLGPGLLQQRAAAVAAKVALADVAVINFGAHYSNVDLPNVSAYQVFVDDLLSLASTLRNASSESDGIVVWRSTPQGHPGCVMEGKGCRFGTSGRPHCPYLEPPRGSTALEEVNRHWSTCPECLNQFNWHLFPSYDNVARELLEPVGVRFLDVSIMSRGRPDAHTAVKHGQGKFPPDCLHWALPGVPDWWNALLFGALLECG
jgi:hypothetical protein